MLAADGEVQVETLDEGERLNFLLGVLHALPLILELLQSEIHSQIYHAKIKVNVAPEDRF